MTDDQQQDSQRVAALIAYIRANSFLIDGAATGTIALTWNLNAPIAGEVRLSGYGGRPAPTPKPGSEGSETA